MHEKKTTTTTTTTTTQKLTFSPPFLLIKTLKTARLKFQIKQSHAKENASIFKQIFIIYLNSPEFSLQTSLIIFKCFLK